MVDGKRTSGLHLRQCAALPLCHHGLFRGCGMVYCGVEAKTTAARKLIPAGGEDPIFVLHCALRRTPQPWRLTAEIVSSPQQFSGGIELQPKVILFPYPRMLMAACV